MDEDRELDRLRSIAALMKQPVHNRKAVKKHEAVLTRRPTGDLLTGEALNRKLGLT